MRAAAKAAAEKNLSDMSVELAFAKEQATKVAQELDATKVQVVDIQKQVSAVQKQATDREAAAKKAQTNAASVRKENAQLKGRIAEREKQLKDVKDKSQSAVERDDEPPTQSN